MKSLAIRIIILLFVIVFLFSCGVLKDIANVIAPEECSTKYVIRRTSTAGVCQVWVSTASPIGAAQVGDTYCSREDAEAAMCRLLAEGKCEQINPANSCR